MEPTVIAGSGIALQVIEKGLQTFQGKNVKDIDFNESYTYRPQYPAQEPLTAFQLPTRFIERNFRKISIHKCDCEELNNCLKYLVSFRTFCLSILHKKIELAGFDSESVNDRYYKGSDINRTLDVLEKVQEKYIQLFPEDPEKDMTLEQTYDKIRKKAEARVLSRQTHLIMTRVYGQARELYEYIQKTYECHSNQLNYMFGDINIENVKNLSGYGEILVYMKYMLLPRINDLYQQYSTCVKNVQIGHQIRWDSYKASLKTGSGPDYWEPIDTAYDALLNDIIKSFCVIDNLGSLANLLIELESVFTSLLKETKIEVSKCKKRILVDLFTFPENLSLKWTNFKLEM